jgi:hypothetical protein
MMPSNEANVVHGRTIQHSQNVIFFTLRPMDVPAAEGYMTYPGGVDTSLTDARITSILRRHELAKFGRHRINWTHSPV